MAGSGSVHVAPAAGWRVRLCAASDHVLLVGMLLVVMLLAVGGRALAQGASFAQATPSPPLTELSAMAGPIEPSAMRYAVVPRRDTSAGPLTDPRAPWQQADGPFPQVSLTPDNEAWVHLRLINRDANVSGWQLHIDLPAADLVMVYQRSAAGSWRAQTAGDEIAMSRWPLEGRFPRFDLELPAAQPRDVFVRVRNANASPLAVRLVTLAQAESIQRREYLVIGLTLGVALLVVGACLTQAWVYREADYAGYALYAVVFGLLVASNTGVASEFIWGEWPRLANPLKNGLALWGASTSALFLTRLCRTAQKLPWLAHLAQAVGGIGLLLGVVVVLWPGATLPLLPLGMVSCLLIVGVVSIHAWWRGDVVGAWVLMSYLPLAVVTALVVARVVDLPVPRFSAYGLVALALALSLPVLLVAIHLRTRDSHAVRVRELELAIHDPLTGALSPHLLQDRLRALVSRRRRGTAEAAILYVRLANLPRIEELYGASVAEHTLIRAALKLNRLLEDADAIGRVDHETFGVILESVQSREAVQELGSRIVAHGLMPPPRRRAATSDAAPVTMTFHVVGSLLSECPPDAGDIHQALTGQLDQMARGTRRPVRLLGMAATQPPTGPVPAA